MMFRTAASPQTAYAAAMDYNSQMLSAVSMYSHGMPMSPAFGMDLRGFRRGEYATPRSAKLDEFRASRGKKWELKVNKLSVWLLFPN